MHKLKHSNGLDNPSRRAWIAQARAVRLETELERRGVMLNGGGPQRRGPCLWCGNFNCLVVNVSTQQWSCGTCQRSGDVVSLVQHLDRVSFLDACRALTGYAAPGRDERASGASPPKHDWKTAP
jgi:hypothetical protein